MREPKIQTEVDLKLFNQRVKIEEDMSVIDSDERYVYKVSHEEVFYVLKGYKIQIEHLIPGNKEAADLFKDSIRAISEVFQEYYFARIASLFNPHFAKPLFLDYTIELAENEFSGSYMYIEIIFEYGGTNLHELEHVTFNEAYNLMRQSANALRFLHDIGIVHFDIKPASMVYDKNNDMLKIINMNSAFGAANREEITEITQSFYDKIRSTTTEYSPPEVLRKLEDKEEIPDLKTSLDNIDVYSWGMCFYSMLLKKTHIDLQKENNHYKLGSGKDYKDYIKIIEASLNAINVEDSIEKELKDKIKDLLLGALSYKPRSRPAMKTLVADIKKFEKQKNINIKYALTEATINRELMKMLIFDIDDLNNKDLGEEESKKEKEPKEEEFIEPKYSKCDSCSKLINMKGILVCGDKMCKNCLIKNVLKSFLKKEPYKYLCFCSDCYSIQRLSVLVLDCGCVWEKFGERIMNKAGGIDYDKCDKQHKLNSIDFCLINDFPSFRFVYLMIFDYLTQIDQQTSVTDKTISSLSMENIDCLLKITKSITRLDLSNKKIGSAGAKVISESLKINTTVTILDLEYNNIGVEGAKIISEALKINTTFAILNLKLNNIGDKGGKAIGEALKVNKTLAILYLEDNRIGVESAKVIGEALEVNRRLTNLYLWSNNIGDEGVKAITEALKINKTLAILHLEGNNIGDEGAKVIGEVLKVNTTLTSLNLLSNNIGDEGAKVIAKGFKDNKTLTSLNLLINNIGDKGAKAINKAFKVNKTLTILNLRYNKIGIERKKEIEEANKEHKGQKIYC